VDGRGLLGDLGGAAQLDQGDAELELVAGGEVGRAVDGLAVHEGPVAGAEVLDERARPARGDLRVVARDQLVGQHQVGVPSPADGHRPGERDHRAGAGALHDLQAQLGHLVPPVQVRARQPATPAGAFCPSATSQSLAR
jgi:hypothetical protein